MKRTFLLSLFLIFVVAVVPFSSTAAPAGTPTGVPAGEQGADLLDLNKAGVEELTSLRGIGPVLAQRIVDYRKQIGTFTSLDDLLEVRGIGENNLNRLRNSLTLSPPPSPAAKKSSASLQ